MAPDRICRFLGSLLIVGACLIGGGARSAWAIPVGEFAWQPDEGFGETFSVANFSPDYLPAGESFFDVFIRLMYSDGTFAELGLGDVAPGDSVQTTESLSDLEIQAASLELSFPLGQVTFESLTVADSFSLIDFAQNPDDPSAVPEPSSLVLVAVGAASALLGGWRRRTGLGSDSNRQ